MKASPITILTCTLSAKRPGGGWGYSLILAKWICVAAKDIYFSTLGGLSPERVVRVRALAEDVVLCSWARHLTLTVPLFTQVYKWVLVYCWGNLTNCGGMTCDGLASCPGGVEILLAASCYRNRG